MQPRNRIRFGTFLILALTCVVCPALAGPSQPIDAITLVKPGDFPPRGDFVVGYKFTVITPITITSVGIFDRSGDGVLKGTSPIEIGVWDSMQKMIVSAELPLSAKASKGIFYAEVKPLTLAPGSYVIAYASPEGSERYWFGAEITTAPQIRWEQGLYASGKNLVLPTNTAPGKAYFGPNFQFVPAGANYTAPVSARISIDAPLDRAVYQRNDHNVGAIPIACTAPASAKTLEARAVDLNTHNPACDWKALSPGKDANSFVGDLQVAAGWYAVEVRATGDSKNGSATTESDDAGKGNSSASPLSATVGHVGVGEVFLTCGQSNSCNHGRPRQSPTEDCVDACDWQSGVWRHADDPQPGAEGDGGSPWPMLGDLLVKKYHVPVGFISVGVGATAVEQWLPDGDLYRRIKIGLDRAGPHGIRAILWHQGEQDSVAGTSSDEYYHALALIIARSRHDAGWQVPWGVALVSYHPSAPAANYPPIIAGQKLVIANEPDVFTGPSTDSFHLHDWMADAVHFNAKGLAAHAQGWADALAPLVAKEPK
jgi:hypothetical protein